MEKKVSVLVPVYGVEKYIKKCCISLFENTIAKECEFIFIDDCTKDNSINILKDIIEKYRELDIKIVEHEENKGLAGARNTGIYNATGEYIICVDSDDWVEPDYLELLYNEAKKNDADVVTCSFFENENGIDKIVKQKFEGSKEDIYKGLLTDSIMGYVWCKLIRRSIFTKYNLSWQQGLNMWEDLYITTQVFYFSNKFSSVEKALYHYRLSNSSSIVHSKELKKFKDQFEVLHFVETFLKEKNIFDKFKNEFFFRVIIAKFSFTFTFVCKKKYLDFIFDEGEKMFLKKNRFLFSTQRKLYIDLLLSKMTGILFVLCLIKSKIKHNFSCVCNFSEQELDFINTIKFSF